jgi:hypothetical protein
MASYTDMKYFFWIVSVLIPLLYVLYVKGKPLLKEEGEKEKRAIFVFTFYFVCLMLTLFAAILIEH